jgi:hypothetical protein
MTMVGSDKSKAQNPPQPPQCADDRRKQQSNNSHPRSNKGWLLCLMGQGWWEVGMPDCGNDTFNGSDKTLVLDVLDGATGTDTLNYSDSTGGVNINRLGLTLASV